MFSRKRGLYIISAGPFAREVLEWMLQTNEFLSRYAIKGFLHDAPDESVERSVARTGLPLLGSWKDFDFPDGSHAVNPTGSGDYRKTVAEALSSRVTFPTFIHRSVIIGRRVEIGAGCIVCPNCVLTTDIEVGRGVVLNNGTQVGHDVTIGDFASLMAQVEVGGGVSVGELSFIGSGAVIHPQTVVEGAAKVGIGSVVIKRVRAGEVVFGNPAKRIN